MSRFVVDASVAVKWFVPEVHTSSAVRLVENAHDLLAPDLLIAEFGNILWKKVRMQELTPSDARQIAASFRRVPMTMEPTAGLLEAALELALRLDRTVYDSMYLALAIKTGAPMITADTRLFRTISASSLSQHITWIAEIP